MRFEERLEVFIQRLRLSGNHLGPTAEGLQNEDNEDGGERRKRMDKLYRNWIVDLLDCYALLSKECSSIKESAPNVKGPFTGLNALPFWMEVLCCRCPRPVKFDGKEFVHRIELSKNGTLVQCYEQKCRQRQEEKSRSEDEIVQNVERVFLEVGGDAEPEDPFSTVFNRSNFDHVPYVSSKARASAWSMSTP